MAELNSRLFEQFRKAQTVTSTKCDKHDCFLIKSIVPEPHTYCPECQKESIEQRSKSIVSQSVKLIQKRRTTDMLAKDSILGDDSLKDAKFDSYKPDSDEASNNLKLAKKIAYQYLNKDNQFNTIITGPAGRGKSHLALSILKAVNDFSKEPTSCLFVTTDELFRLIKSSFDYRESKYTEANMVDLLTRADLLVLDDLGSESSFKKDANEASDFVQRILFGVFNNRNRTIITTNLNSKELADMYNPKLISRMEKGVKEHIIKFTDKTTDKRQVEF